MHLKNVSTIKSGTPVHKYKKYTNMKRARFASSLFGRVETREALDFPFVFHMGRVREFDSSRIRIKREIKWVLNEAKI